MKHTVTALLLLMSYATLFGQVTVTIDFTDPATPTFGTNAQKVVNVDGDDVRMLWAGDTNGDGIVRYSDYFLPPATFIPSDALAIFNYLGGDPANQVDNYSSFDVNLDGKVRYSDLFVPPFTFLSSDALLIFNILGGNPAGEISQKF